MSTKIKVKFIKECFGLMHKGVTATPLCNFYASTKTCCDKIGELSLVCNNKCKNVQIEVQEGLIFDSRNITESERWKPTINLSRNDLNGKMEGKWYVRTRDQNKINLIIRETLSEGLNNEEERSFALELEAPETENEKIIDESPELPITFDLPNNFDAKSSMSNSQDSDLLQFLSLGQNAPDYTHDNVSSLCSVESIIDSDNENNDEISHLSIDEIINLSPGSKKRVCSGIKKPKLKRQVAGYITELSEKRNNNDDISLLTTSPLTIGSECVTASSSYSSMHDDCMASAVP